jgi:hypothetical protein
MIEFINFLLSHINNLFDFLNLKILLLFSNFWNPFNSFDLFELLFGLFLFIIFLDLHNFIKLYLKYFDLNFTRKINFKIILHFKFLPLIFLSKN